MSRVQDVPRSQLFHKSAPYSGVPGSYQNSSFATDDSALHGQHKQAPQRFRRGDDCRCVGRVFKLERRRRSMRKTPPPEA